MNEARQHILDRLRDAQIGKTQPAPVYAPPDFPAGEDRIQHFIAMIEAVRGKVLRVPGQQWYRCLTDILDEYQVKRLLLTNTEGPAETIWKDPPGGIELVAYRAPIESWKHELFCDIDAALTTSAGGIAETGSIILRPSAAEPRLMSLIPPMHIVLLDARKLYGTLGQAMREQNWAAAMPSNLLLISGPSKSADIEQVLAYGVHGPKQLIVILQEFQ